MNWLFIRGFVPQDRDPNEIRHATLAEDDDMWVQLFAAMVGPEDSAMILYLNKTRDVPPYRAVYRENLIIQHMPYIEHSVPMIGNKVDVVFARGGHPEYDGWLRACKGARLVYYGAGRRYIPPANGFCDYHLVLVDSPKQAEELRSIYRDMSVALLPKPAADNVFGPRSVPKTHDLCFIANGQQAAFKGVEWVYQTAPEDLSILHLGFPSSYRAPPNVTTRRVLHRDMATQISQCRVGVVPYFNKIDSGPRVVPEMLACGLPLVVADCLRFDRQRYMGIGLGAVANKRDFWVTVRRVLTAWTPNDTITVRRHYTDNLSVPVAAPELREVICGR